MKLFEDLPSQNTPINAENLNQIQDNLVVVSATEPTGDNREKVWIQKGKNLFDMNLIPNTDVMTNDKKGTLTIANNASNVGYVDTGMKLSAVFKGIVGQTYISSFENTFSMAGRNDRFYLSGVNAYIIKNTPFILTQDMLDSTIILYGGYNETSTIKNMQIEQNSTVTSYETYIEPKIYVLNDNDVYEEFISKDNLVNYSTGEQRIGTWINGKPLYGKVISGTTPSTTTDTKVFSISNIETLVDIKGVIDNWLPINSIASAENSSILYYQPEGFMMAVGSTQTNKLFIAIIEYTKTTD